MNDIELLRAYAHGGSQDAFADIAQRHAHLVFSTAHRMLADSHLAEDVTQQVFILLAQKAGTLRDGVILPGWLYRAARNLASETMRHEKRRQHREQRAVEAVSGSGHDTAWTQIGPLLDDAMAGLRMVDHDAIVLRYFENKSLREVGEAFGWTEDAAQKRIARALGRLHTSLLRRGVAVSVTALGAAVSSGAMQSAPVGLLASAASAGALSAGSSGLVYHSVSCMAAAKLKAVGTVLALGALAFALVIAWKENVALRRQIEVLRASRAGAAELREVGSMADQTTVRIEDLRRLRLEHLEVLSLRGRVAQMANELRHQGKANNGQAKSASDRASGEGDSLLFTAALTNRISHGHTLVVGGWSLEGMRGYLLATPVIQPENSASEGRRIAVQSQVIGAPESFWEQIGWGAYRSNTRRSALAGVLTAEQIDSLIQVLRETAGAELSNISSVTNQNGDRVGFGLSTDDGQNAGVLLGVDLYPWITSDGQAVDLELRPSAVSPETVHSSLKRGN